MNIEQLINKDAEKYSPYMGSLINHLPMVKYALFSITKDINKVEIYVDYYLSKYKIDKVKENYEKVNFIEECLGNNDLYESCLGLIREISKEKDIEDLVRLILKKYPLGLSSDLFHTIIRLSYAIEGYILDKNLKTEVERALAYYITGYREGSLFKRQIPKEDVIIEMNKLIHVKDSLLRIGFIIDGNEEDKVKGLLQILIPAFYNSNSIVMLHCITGLQAVVTLKDYFDDYMVALDILTTSAIIHLLSQTNLNIKTLKTKLDESWDVVMKKASESKNIHTIKLAYTSKKLYDLFKVVDLKFIANKRIDLEKRLNKMKV